MKKTVLSLGLLMTLASASSQADTLLGLYAGAQGWNMQTAGGFSDDGDNRDFNFDTETKTNIYVAFEHPIPVIPNIKLQRTEMDTMGDITIEQQFEFYDQLYMTNSNLNTDVQLTSTDYILYYELFDNDLISFDFGLTGKHIKGEFIVTNKDDPSETSNEDFSFGVPMLYSRLAVGIPFSGFGAYAEGHYLSIGDNTVSDMQAVVTYSLMENLALDVTFQFGYRLAAVELDYDFDVLGDTYELYSDLEFKGFFAGIEVHF